MAAAGVDVGYLATHLGLPETNISGAISDPTVDLVSAILAAVATKAHEFDTLFSQKLQLEVELETSVRSAEAQRDASNETAKKALKDVEEIRQKLNEEETRRQALENELQSLKSSSSTSQYDIDSLRSRIVSLETSNRESLAIIDTKNSTNESLSQELQAQHQKTLELNREVTTLQQAVQNANATASSSKIREQGLQRQLEAARRDVEWTDQELKRVSAEALSYRKEKGARIAELQRQNDDAASTVESLKRGEQQLRQRLQDAQRKADEALAKVQQLEEAAARREEDFQERVDRLQRLHELTEQQNTTQKNRLRAMEEREAQVKRECEDKVQQISKEIASLNMDKEELAQANESLQAEVGRLEAMMAGGSGRSPGQPGSAPQTPRPMNGSMYRPSSPFTTPGSMRKSISTTQALDEYYKVKGQLSVEKQRANTLAKDLEDVLEQLQAKAPELEELYAENERLQSEIQTMSHLSDESFRERDIAKKAARKAESTASQSQAQISILRNQIRDLGAQIQMLLFNLHCRDKGLDELSIEETLHFQKLERGQVEGNADSINSMILQRLVVFKDIQELQEKNEKLLQVTIELGQNMESEEAIAAKNQAVEDHKERNRLQQELDVFKDTLRSFKIKTESITKERDMFRRIVESRASADEIASALGHPPQSGVLASIENNTSMNADGDYATLLEDIRKEFDDYRNEQTTDRKTLKEQIEKLSAERNKLQKRFEMLKSNYKRNQTMSESAAKQDIITQNVAEEVVEARTMMESMRNDNANLRAEKTLWQDIQNRLKSRLNSLLTTHQTLQNEPTIDTLEAELTSNKRKLAEEVEEAKKAQLRKEYDAQHQIREELVAVKTSRDHLQSRERTERLQPRPTPRPGSVLSVFDENATQQDGDEHLKRDLEMTKSQLENAQEQAERYKELSQASEEELERLNSAHEQYAEEMDNQLEQRLEDISSELSKTNSELSALRDSQADVTRRFEDEKGILEEEYRESSKFHQNDLRAQAEIASKTAKALSHVRNEHNQLKTSVARYKAEADSWDERRQNRWEDANAQNKLLHQQLENSRASSNESLETISAQPSSTDADKYRELSNYLRREKDILEVQLQQQLELKLEQERGSHGANDRNTMAHKDLMSKLEELNLFPRQAQAQLTEKIAKITELESTIQPLEAQIEELQSQQSFKEAEMKQIQEDRDRWQKHPAEVEELRQKEAEAPLKEKIQELENTIATKEAEWERSRQLTTAKNQKFEEAAKTFKQAKSELEEQVLEFKRQVETLQAEPQQNVNPVASSESPDSQAALSELQGQLNATPSIEQELQNTRDQLNSVMAEKEQGVSEAHTQTNGDSAMENGAETGQNHSTESIADSQPLSADERKQLEERIAAAEARAAEWEAKAKELEENQDTIVKHRSDKMKEALNKLQLQQDKERLDADFKLRMEQERKIWETEQASMQNESRVPSTPQQPKLEAQAMTPNTSVPDLANLGDQEIRELVSKNATIRSIVQNNIKSKLAAETKRMKEEHDTATKAEWEQKLAQARESATHLATTKMNLKLNMTENRARAANAKIEVVETAAKETPERAVGEVWDIAKIAKPPPAPKQPAPSATPMGSTAAAAPLNQSTPSKQTSTPQETKPTPSTTIPPKPAAPNLPQAVKTANNPFANSQQDQAPAANPFTQSGLPTPQQTAPTGMPQPAQPSSSQIPKVSNLPIPGGARKPGGPQIPRGGARGGGSQRGRGGGHPGRASLNPSADNFQPGLKRPRGDSEVGNGQKRPRGGGGS
ncbi:hypothetical protein F4678DRAFT_471201 [Xylaria arbuscula]|nr:hypothetical protein F4678DRAFT_471201 [Xylaria arbuscula]